MKLMNSIKISWLVTFIAGLFFIAQAQIQVDIPKNLRLTSPSYDSEVAGIVNIRWWYRSTEKRTVEYELLVYSGRCDSVLRKYVGTIDRGIKDVEANVLNYFSSFWDSNKKLLNTNPLEDGEYCLSTVISEDQAKPLSESYTNIKLINSKNNPPQTKVALRNIFLKKGETVSIDLDAEDLDGDAVSFKLLEGFENFDLNTGTGVITQKGELKAGTKYNLLVEITDVAKNVVLENIAVNTSPANVDLTSESLKFISPVLSTTFDENNSTIIWTGKDITEVKTQKLFISKDLKTWTPLPDLNVNLDEFELDLESFESGEYYLRLDITYGADNSASVVSDKFLINKEDILNARFIASVYELTPRADQVVTNKRPPISAKFVSSENSSVIKEDTKITLDNVEITALCAINNDGFSCELKDDLKDGSHKVVAEIVEKSLRKTIKEWNFTVQSQTGELDFLGMKIRTENLSVALLLCCGLLLLLFIVWFIYFLLKRRRETKTTSYSTSVYTDPYEPNNININIEQPASTNYDPFAVGLQDLNNEYSDAIKKDQQQKVDVNVYQPQTTQTSLPKSYLDDDIPDWLKDGSSSSNPVGIAGEEIKPHEPLSGTEPYGYQEYGKASND